MNLSATNKSIHSFTSSLNIHVWNIYCVLGLILEDTQINKAGSLYLKSIVWLVKKLHICKLYTTSIKVL